MRRWLPLILLVLCPLLGFGGGTLTSWIVYPKDDTKNTREAMEEVSARGNFILWGSIIGAGVGIIGA